MIRRILLVSSAAIALVLFTACQPVNRVGTITVVSKATDYVRLPTRQITKTAQSPTKTSKFPQETPVPSETPHPIATLGEMEAYKIENFLSGDVCALPCWSELVPGTSSPTELPKFFAKLGIDIEGVSPIEIEPGLFAIGADFPSFGDILLSSVSVVWDEERVRWIKLNYYRRPPKFLSPRYFLSVLGEPAEILIAISGAEASPLYNLISVYPEHGVAISIRGFSSYSDKPRICFIDDEFMGIDAWLYAQDEPFRSESLFAEDLHEPEFYTGLTRQEVIDYIYRGNCIPIQE